MEVKIVSNNYKCVVLEVWWKLLSGRNRKDDQNEIGGWRENITKTINW